MKKNIILNQKLIPNMSEIKAKTKTMSNIIIIIIKTVPNIEFSTAIVSSTSLHHFDLKDIHPYSI